jgi:hypothetical protein
MWWEFQDRFRDPRYEPMEGPMPFAVHGPRMWNAIDAKWNRIRPSSNFTVDPMETYWEAREREMRSRGTLNEWVSSVLTV